MNVKRASNEMDKVVDGFNRFANFVDRDIKGVHIGCYSVALIGLTIAIRKVRPISKFKRPNDIPNHFIQEQRELIGQVKRLDPNGALLMIEHKPLLDIPLIRPGQLPVKISGVDVNGLGLSWLQSIVAGRTVRFIPVSKDRQFVQCRVLLVEREYVKKTNEHKETLLNIGEHLVKIGFAQTHPVSPPLSEDPTFITYYKRLQAAENYALRKKLGIKYYIKPTQNFLISLYKNLDNLLRKLTTKTTKKLKELPNISTV